MDRFLSDDEVSNLLLKIKDGDGKAWALLYENFKSYIHERSWKKLWKFDLSEAVKKDVEMDLVQAGWYGFSSAVKNFNPERGKFLTYATYYIDGEISKELDFRFNPLGLTNRPDYKNGENHQKQITRVSFDDEGGIYDEKIRERLYSEQTDFHVKDAPDRGKYPAERRVLQILDILKLLTDENHNLSKDEIGKLLSVYRAEKYDNGTSPESPNTLTSTLENMLLELNPEEYSKEKEEEYRVIYEGYTEDRLKKKRSKEKGKKSADISGFSYVHKFSFDELDKMIQMICFSDMFEENEKRNLVRKLVSTSSTYYRTPFWNGNEIQFNPSAIHGRLSTRQPRENHKAVRNLQVLQYAINNLVQVNFRFNQYTASHEMVPKSDYIHVLSPYHLVVYHDNYYCIGLKKDDKRIWHYRVDLMTDVKVIKDDTGKSVPVEIAPFEGNPICNASWDPEKYMAEHLNMAYDEPQDIRIKIKDSDYTILHDWFGNHYEKTEEPSEEGYDIVKVRTSPNMIVHWAMQYGTAVEIINEDTREAIRSKISDMRSVYEQ